MAAPSNGPISLTAPGVAPQRRRNRTAGRGHAGAARRIRARRPIRSATAYPRAIAAALSPPYRRALFAAARRAQPCRGSVPRRAIPSPRSGPVAVKPAATLACPIVSVLDRWLADSVQPAAHALVRRARGRDQADLRLFLPRHERQSERAYFRTRLRQRARYRRLHARRRPAHLGEGRLEGHAGRAGLSARRAGARPASNSPPCWRRAPTSITTITSTSI